MFNTIKRIGFRTVKMTAADSDSLPFNPHIELVAFESVLNRDTDDALRLTPHLMTDGEIDHYVQALKDNLDAVGVQAKAALALARADTRSIVDRRRRR